MKVFSLITRSFLIAAAAVVVLALLALPAAAESPADLAKRIQERYRQVNSLAADYTRVSQFAALAGQSSRQVKGSGRLLWVRPLKLRLDQAQPRQETILCADRRVWWLRPEQKRADLYPLDQFTSGLTSLLQALSGLGDLGKEFSVGAPDMAQAAGGPQGALSLLLTPLQRRADLQNLVLWFQADGLLLLGFKIINLVGDVTIYSFNNLLVNAPAPEERFRFTPPTDWRTLDHRPTRPEDAAQGR
ncbi:MAG: outer membrane lipoprotein carrier protein LolA [Thermodesulfobacteriota bacterium]